jgi:methyl-accepting chemotaxis protein
MTFLNRLTITQKLSLIVVGASVSLTITIGAISFWNASAAITTETREKLLALSEDRKVSMTEYLGSIEQDLRINATSPAVQDAVVAFTNAWNEIPGSKTKYLQEHYITGNPNPTGQKEILNAANDGSTYSVEHALYHPWFRNLLQERGYYDIFLFDTSGNLIYTVFKELDYATNLMTDQWRGTDLGNAYRSATADGAKGDIHFFDFKPYAPSHGAPASFISTPIVSPSGRPLGVIAFQMPIDRINKIMSEKAGLGESGETFIVGSDFLMRNDSSFESQSTILAKTVETITVKSALSGAAAVSVEEGLRDRPVLSAAHPLDFQGIRWAVVAEQETREIQSPIYRMAAVIFGACLVFLIVVSAGGVLVSRRLISTPVAALTATMLKLSEGDTTVDIIVPDQQDEIAEMTRAVAIFKENALDINRLEQEKDREDKERLRAAAVRQLISSFEEKSKAMIDDVRIAAQEMEKNAGEMTKSADETLSLSSNVSDASSEATESVQAVAAAAEQLSKSIEEISGQVVESSRMSDAAASKANETNDQVGGLVDAAQKIGDIVQLISDIAGQTNLLALNATIEAARAGDAGKGFAVVASEVKGLATQTSKATGEIAEQIGDIQQATEKAATSIGAISSTINDVNQVASIIAAAVEEQGAATQEISSSAQRAAGGAADVTGNIAHVSEASNRSGAASRSVLEAAANLRMQADALQTEVSQFLSSVEAA